MAGHIGSSSSVEWYTPQVILTYTERTFQTPIDLDPCASAHSLVKAERKFVLPYNDGLKEDWGNGNNVYVNPPYGRYYMHKDTKAILSAKEFEAVSDNNKDQFEKHSIKDWIVKCDKEGKNNNIIALIPAAVGTSAWQELIFPYAAKICFIKGRLKFLTLSENNEIVELAPAPMDCAVVLWTYNSNMASRFSEIFGEIGRVV